MALALGPFDLVAPLARGAMGEVWQGLHRETGLAVAVKVITRDGARRPEIRRAITREVRAMARLSHPHIVRVFDFGQVPEALEIGSDGRLVAGSPVMVVELVKGGTLADHVGSLDWPATRRVLSRLLSALTHAHHRDALHRDLKPQNVLLDGHPSALQVKLTDFGIAHSMLVPDDEAPRVAGTPGYMAPEQKAGRWRDFGPWTDLYAVGRLAIALMTGDPRGKESADRYVPRGFTEWLARMTAVEPKDRFRFTADAVLALHNLGRPDVRLSVDAVLADVDTADTMSWTRLDASIPPPSRSAMPTPDLPPVQKPVPPKNWRTNELIGPSEAINDAGLGLLDLRIPPIFGRTEVQETTWAALRSVYQDKRPSVCVIEGPSGDGKGRILRWLDERVWEVGAAFPMRHRHDPARSPDDAMLQILELWHRSKGLEGSAIRRRCAWVLSFLGVDDSDLVARTAMVLGTRNSGSRDASLGGTPLAVPVTDAFVRAVALDRPVVLAFDDVQWGSTALMLTKRLLEDRPTGFSPILVMLTVDPEVMKGRPREQRLLEDVQRAAGDRFTRVRLAPLSDNAIRHVLRSLLPIGPRLMTALVDRAEGRPGFAVSLLREIVRRGEVVPGKGGFTLAPGVTLPDSALDLWAERVNEFVASLSLAQASALERAAVGGREVVPEVWGRVIADSLEPLSLLDLAQGHGLVICQADGRWTFSSERVRGAFVNHATTHKRAADHHRAWATYDASVPWPDHGLIARHLAKANDHRQALPHFAVGVERALVSEQEFELLRLAGLWLESVDALGLDEWSQERCEARHAEVRTKLSLHQITEADHLATELLDRVRLLGIDPLLGSVLWTKGRLAQHQSNYEDAVHHLTEGGGIAHKIGDDITLARCLANLGKVAIDRGYLEPARQALEEAEMLYRRTNHHGLFFALINLADCTRRLGDLDQAETLARAAFEINRRGQDGRGGDAATLLGEIARSRGDYEAAEGWYRGAIRIHRFAESSPDMIIDYANLGILMVRRGRHAEAIEKLSSCLTQFHRSGRRGFAGILHTVLLESFAALGDLTDFDAHLERAEVLLAETGIADVDAYEGAQRAIVYARQRGWNDRAVRVERLANEQAARLGK